MRLYLIRHGEAGEDKNLTEKGKADVAQATEFLKEKGVSVAEVYHSGKPRAEQTAELLEQGAPKEREGLKPNDPVEAIATGLEGLEADMMLVGHLPFMNRLASLLVAGDAEASLFEFGAGSILCLEKDGGKWVVEWMFDPEL